MREVSFFVKTMIIIKLPITKQAKSRTFTIQLVDILLHHRFRSMFPATVLALSFVLTAVTYNSLLDNYHEELSHNAIDEEDIQNKGPSWHLVFSDEFSGTSLNRTKWEYQSGCDERYGKRNLQCYISGTNNVKVRNGMLVITAKIQDAENKHFTSGRIRQLGRGSAFGKYVLRARVPAGARLWPGLWLKNRVTTKCYHEIDILEMMGEIPSRPIFTAHYGLKPSSVVTHGAAFQTLIDFSQDFHNFQVIWTPETIAWYVDSKLYLQVPLKRSYWEAPNTLTCSAQPFSEAQGLILNLAVGGSMYDPHKYPILTPEMARRNWTKATLEIDYVRVYELK